MTTENRRSGIPPRPEVQYLPTLLRRIGIGEIRIPAFQRNLVWSNEQIRALFESIYKGYPIGSLLLWQAPAEMFEPFVPEGVSLPKPDTTGMATYVLDGMQRLISLYAAFNGGGGSKNRFDLVFGLEQQSFFHDPRGRLGENPKYVKLSKVFAPRQFVEYQAQLATLDEPDKWLSLAIELHSRFQEYLIPIVTIEGASADEAVKIFTNINREGLSLSSVDFMRALTWHNNFDLNIAVEKIRGGLPEAFSPDDEILAKTIAFMIGIDPLPDSILKLQDTPVGTLEEGVSMATSSLAAVASFLKDRVGIASAEFVPYEGQLLVLAGLFNHGPLAADIQEKLLKWYLITSFSEAFQGRPDHAIVQMAKTAVASLSAGSLELNAELEVDADELQKKQLRKGTAVSAGLLALFSMQNARSITTGQIIDRKDYLEAFDGAKLLPLFTGNGGSVPKNARRRIANLVLISTEEAYSNLRPDQALEALRKSPEELLKSQLLDAAAIELASAGDYDAFLAYRVRLIIETMRDLISLNEIARPVNAS